MKRAAIYARYSTDRQSETSAEDQVRLCRERAAREGWSVVGTFLDEAISGTQRDRPGLNALLERAGDLDVLLAESIDRISRDQEDLPWIFKRVRHAGVAIVTLSEGEVGEIHIGLGGTMAALYVKQLGEKTRRGQIGRVAIGRIPGGISYGYRKLVKLDSSGVPETGLREIDEAAAEVVRRIFAEFLAGRSPQAIARGLNDDGIASPSGGQWRANAIVGSRSRRNGILHNELYAGRIVYNRQRFLRDPVTRKRVSRLNPVSEWKIVDVPEFRVVDEETWAATVARFERTAGLSVSRQRRPKRLFSGLVRCGECGGAVTILGNEKWGCTGARQGTSCNNRRMIGTRQLETRILRALREEMLAPEAVKAAVSEYHLELERDRRGRAKRRGALERTRDRAQARVDRLIALAGEGLASIEDVRTAIRNASNERDRAAAELAELAAEPVIALNAAIAERFKRAVDDLTEALSGPPEHRPRAKAAIRDLVGVITLYPHQSGRGVALEVTGVLASILHIAKGRPKAANGTASVVAGAGFEPATFRL